MSNKLKRLCFLLFVLPHLATAGVVTANFYDMQGESLGEVRFEDGSHGLMIYPNLKKLPCGVHGFHVHQFPSCAEQGMKAGGHYDPSETKTHQGPYARGHIGDMPALAVNQKGIADTITLAPRLTTKDLKGRSIIIHEGSDNYSDKPTLGGGGKRIACAVLESADH